jgi:hypothetical protein
VAGEAIQLEIVAIAQRSKDLTGPHFIEEKKTKTSYKIF